MRSSMSQLPGQHSVARWHHDAGQGRDELVAGDPSGGASRSPTGHGRGEQGWRLRRQPATAAHGGAGLVSPPGGTGQQQVVDGGGCRRWTRGRSQQRAHPAKVATRGHHRGHMSGNLPCYKGWILQDAPSGGPRWLAAVTRRRPQGSGQPPASTRSSTR